MTEHLTPAHYFDLLRFAKRQTRRAAEAEDLLHEALIVALKAKRFPTVGDRAWFCGVIRKLAAMQGAHGRSSSSARATGARAGNAGRGSVERSSKQPRSRPVSGS